MWKKFSIFQSSLAYFLLSKGQVQPEKESKDLPQRGQSPRYSRICGKACCRPSGQCIDKKLTLYPIIYNLRNKKRLALFLDTARIRSNWLVWSFHFGSQIDRWYLFPSPLSCFLREPTCATRWKVKCKRSWSGKGALPQETIPYFFLFDISLDSWYVGNMKRKGKPNTVPTWPDKRLQTR